MSNYYRTRVDGSDDTCTSTIDNCANLTDATTCAGCVAGYWLTSNVDSEDTCTLGDIDGCLIYTSETVCSVCNVA